jgi:hypothetical protein
MLDVLATDFGRLPELLGRGAAPVAPPAPATRAPEPPQHALEPLQLGLF